MLIEKFYKMDSLISNRDFRRFNDFLRNGAPGAEFYTVDDSLPPISQIFSGDNYYAILFLRNPGSEIGHWVTLICHEEGKRYEYFDCLGNAPPPIIFKRLRELGESVKLEFTSRSLMGKTNNICGRWVFCRLLALPATLKEFLDFFSKLKGHTPDSLVSFLFKIPNP